MPWPSLRPLTRILRRRNAGRDLDDEIRFHLAEETRLLADRGTAPGDARKAARRAFGSIALVKEETRAVWIWTALEQLVQDLRYGVRILKTAPGLSATAVLLLAIVIGGNTTVFSMAHALLHKPAPGVTARNLFRVNWVGEDGLRDPATSVPNFLDLAAGVRTLHPFAGFEWRNQFTLTLDEGSYAVTGASVTRDYFETLGVDLARGRTFTPGEYEGGRSDLVAVISHRAWQDLLQGAQDVVGRAIFVNNRPATIVGVTAPPFRGAMAGELSDLWVPVVAHRRATAQDAVLLDRRQYVMAPIAQLAPGVSRTEAMAEMTTLWSRIQADHPDLDRQRIVLVPYSGVSGAGNAIDVYGNQILAIFSIVTLLTLVIVCANIANLLLARAVARQREVALRKSLGAPRLRVVRLLLIEGITLAGLAVAAALIVAWWISRIVPATLEIVPGAALALDLAPDWIVAGYAAALALVAVVSFTVSPALRAWRLDPMPWIKGGGHGVVQGRSRLSSVLVATQLTLAVLLLTSAGLVWRALSLWGNQDPGFQVANLLMVTVNTAGSSTTPEASAALVERARERLAAVPGIERVTFSQRYLFRDGGWLPATLRLPGAAGEPLAVQRNHVGPDFLRTLGVPGLVGREFGTLDIASGTPGAIVAQALAERLWPGAPAIGQTVLVRYRPDRDGPAASVVEREVAVIGIAPPFSGTTRGDGRLVLLSARQSPSPPGEITFYVRHAGDANAMGLAITRALREVDPLMPVVYLWPMETVVASSVWPFRVLTRLLLLFGGGALLIAAIGQYAVVAFDMRRRRRELGLRVALGASPARLLRSIVGEGLRLTLVGLALGAVLSLAVGRALAGVLFGISPLDPMTYGSVAIALAAASLVACYFPARRAAAANPVAALRDE